MSAVWACDRWPVLARHERAAEWLSICWVSASPVVTLTKGLQGARPHALSVLPAQMTRIIALTALIALGLPDVPVHEPVHGRGAHLPLSCYCA
jgi:hypothetical protein